MTTTESNTEPQAKPESTDEQQSTFDLESCSKADLIEIIKELGAEVKELRDRESERELDEGDEATLANMKPWALNPEEWSRGKLPNGKYIASERGGGAYHEVELDEWLRIPAK